jgi:hypothetical protein
LREKNWISILAKILPLYNVTNTNKNFGGKSKMKEQKSIKKLALSKSTVANLAVGEMSDIEGRRRS